MPIPPCGAVARSTRYSAPRALGLLSGTPQPISLMDGRDAGGAGWLPQVGAPAAGWRGDRSRRRAGSCWRCPAPCLQLEWPAPT
jgi:hypothetical protein